MGADYWSRHQDRRRAVAARTQQCVCACAQLPVAFRFTGTEVQAAGMWGVTGAVGAIWLVRLDLPCTTGPGVSARSARKAVLPGGMVRRCSPSAASVRALGRQARRAPWRVCAVVKGTRRSSVQCMCCRWPAQGCVPGHRAEHVRPSAAFLLGAAGSRKAALGLTSLLGVLEHTLSRKGRTAHGPCKSCGTCVRELRASISALLLAPWRRAMCAVQAVYRAARPSSVGAWSSGLAQRASRLQTRSTWTDTSSPGYWMLRDSV